MYTSTELDNWHDYLECPADPMKYVSKQAVENYRQLMAQQEWEDQWPVDDGSGKTFERNFHLKYWPDFLAGLWKLMLVTSRIWAVVIWVLTVWCFCKFVQAFIKGGIRNWRQALSELVPNLFGRAEPRVVYVQAQNGPIPVAD